MKDLNIADFLSIAFDNKMVAGTFTIPDSVLNRDLKLIIMDKLCQFLDDYKISFNGDFIFLQAKLNINTVGKLQANYRLKVENFTFKESTHKISFSYTEDVKPNGGLMQSVALKAFSMNGTYLKSALEYGKSSAKNKNSGEIYNAIRVDNTYITINLDTFEFIRALPASLKLNYIKCQDNQMKFQIE